MISRSTGGNIETQEIRDFARLDTVRRDWKLLWLRAGDTTPFQSPEWLIPWLRRFARDWLALAFWDADRLVGVIVLVRSQRDPSSKLFLAGQGISDYRDGTFERGFEAVVVKAALRWLANSGFENCELANLPSWSPLLSLARLAGARQKTFADQICPVLRLPGSVGALGSIVPERQLEKLRYYRRRAVREQGMFVDCAIEQNIAEALATFIDLHGRRWEERGERGVLADPEIAGFHYEVARAFAVDRILRLYLLRLGSQAAGALYAFAHKHRTYYYLSGFEPRFKNFSPGMLLIGHALEQAILEGAEEFDFLGGTERYKYAWGAVDRPTFTLELTPSLTSEAIRCAS
jgi:CelD/BcsL family acetyltransferase involved in cellulose biosynthesis